MAIIKCPTLDEFTEFNMLTSKVFMKANHRIRSLTIRNHTTNGVTAKDGNQHVIPSGVSTHNKEKVFNVRQHSQEVVRIAVTEIEERNGLEVFQKYLKKKKDLKRFNYYVLILITETTCGDKHTFTWKRENIHKDIQGASATHTLVLTHIDNMKAIENFTQVEMQKLCESLTTYSCRVKEVPASQVKYICP